MKGVRFSIANLLAAVALVGVGLAALNVPTAATASALIVVTSFAFLFATLAAIYSGGESRAFWFGGSLFGWFYFAVAFTPVAPEVKAFLELPLRSFRTAFWTTEIPGGSDYPSNSDTTYDRDRKVTLARPSWHQGFGGTIHCVVSWPVALIGGIVGRLLFDSRAKRGVSP